jgi:hypothetical protein
MAGAARERRETKEGDRIQAVRIAIVKPEAVLFGSLDPPRPLR